jgi:flavin-dependent dehydrogenase
LHTWTGRPGYVRQTHGPGWALIGDAGSFLDPLSTHGITDALRDAASLTRCLTRTGTPNDLNEYATTRNTVINATFDPVDRIASYGWNLDDIRGHLLELSSAMGTELELISKLVAPVPQN